MEWPVNTSIAVLTWMELKWQHWSLFFLLDNMGQLKHCEFTICIQAFLKTKQKTRRYPHLIFLCQTHLSECIHFSACNVTHFPASHLCFLLAAGIIGGVVGSLVLLLIIIVVVVLLLITNKRPGTQGEEWKFVKHIKKKPHTHLNVHFIYHLFISAGKAGSERSLSYVAQQNYSECIMS